MFNNADQAIIFLLCEMINDSARGAIRVIDEESVTRLIYK